MAKKKTGEASAGSSIESALAEIEKAYGEGVIKSGKSVIEQNKTIIPICPSLDAALGGGIPEGSWVSVSGPEKIGKSTLALTFAATAQRPEYGSRPIVYINAEHRIKRRDLMGIKGLDLSPSMFYIVESREGKILSSADFLTIANSFLKDVKNVVLIIDSISSLCSAKLLADGIGMSDYGGGNKVISQFVGMNTGVVPVNNAIVIGIVQYYANTSGMGGPKEKAASAWKYQADVWIQGKYTEAWRTGSDENAQQIGQKIHWSIKTSALGGAPGGKAESYLRYGVGIDKSYELLIAAKDLGLVNTAGSWTKLSYLAEKPELLVGTEFEGKDEVQVQGGEKAVALLDKYPAWAEELNRAYNSFLNGVADEG